MDPVLAPPATQSQSQATLVRGLSLLDSVLLLVGGIIGSSIFLTAKDIAGPLPHPVLFLLVWIIGGGISLLGCTAFAELGSMFPDSGGQYVYLREAYGDLPAFLYGWMLFTVGNGGTIAALAVGSAAYLGGIMPAISQDRMVLSVFGIVLTRAHIVALVMIAVVTWINVVGLRRGAILQNVATWAKFAAMAVFVILGFAIGKGDWHHFTSSDTGSITGLTMGMHPSQLLSAFGVALIAVFWAYDGWVYITWVAGEVKEPRRNIPRSMVLGVIIVGVIYVAMNMTYVYALPLTEIAKHETIAHTAAVALFSPAAATWLSALIALSCFGAMASCVLSGSRVYYAMAKDGVFFKRMAEVHPKWRTPAFALIGQSAWAAVLTVSGRYDQLYTYVMFGMVLSYTLTVIGVFVLRSKRPDAERPYRCTGYPWLPGFYVLVIGAWTLNTIFNRPMEAALGAGIVLLGVPGFLYWKRVH
ncbi:MAG TPA: amino acid permease [Terriglobales bacterium]|nr:amino acid permease [Terriglobales bacterium]